MPLLKFDVVRGRSPEELRLLLDSAHDALVDSFAILRSDRYQVVTVHDRASLVAEDTGLGFARSDKLVLLQAVTRPLVKAEKQAFYARLCRVLKSECGIEPSDVIVSLVENTDADWSFGGGEAQFLTGRLPTQETATPHGSS